MNITRQQIIGILIILVLIVAVIITVGLIRQQQLYRARAEFDAARSFTVTDSNNQPVNCSGTTCTTNASTVHVKFNPNNTQDLLNSLP